MGSAPVTGQQMVINMGGRHVDAKPSASSLTLWAEAQVQDASKQLDDILNSLTGSPVTVRTHVFTNATLDYIRTGCPGADRQQPFSTVDIHIRPFDTAKMTSVCSSDERENQRVQSWIRNFLPDRGEEPIPKSSVGAHGNETSSRIPRHRYLETIGQSQATLAVDRIIHPSTVWRPNAPTDSSETREGSGDDDDGSIASSLVPRPLNLRKSSVQPLPPARFGVPAYRNELPRSVNMNPFADSSHHLTGADGIQGLRSRPDCASSIFRSAQSIRSSLRRVTTMTPGEMPYPYGLAGNSIQDLDRTEQMLGLRPSKPPPLPIKLSDIPQEPNAPPVANTLPRFKDENIEQMLLEPQNGRKAWIHATMAFLVVFNCWGINNAFGLFQAYFEAVYLRHSSPSSIAWIGSTQLALVFGLGVPVGRLVDKGYFRSMFHYGTALMVFGLFVSAWCTQLWNIWLVQGLITGTGMGMAFCSGTVALMTWFDQTTIGLAMGLAAAGSCLGGIVYILMARNFLVTAGYATTMRILGGVAAGTMILPNVFFRMRVQNKKASRFWPDKAEKPRVTWRIFTSAPYLLAAGGMFFAFLGVYFGFVYMISYAYYVILLSDKASSNLLIFMLVANLPGRFVPVLISDQCIGPTNMIIPSIYFSAMMVGVWMTVGKTQVGITTVACLYGFLSAGVQVLYAPTVYSFCLEPAANHETASIRSGPQEQQLAMDRMGVKAGGIFTCIGLACLVGTPIGGALVTYRVERNMSQPFLGAQLFAMGSLLLGGTLLLISRWLRIGWAAKRA